MEPLTVIQSRTAVLPVADVDTDQIIPARFLTTTSREGLGENLFHDWRYLPDGAVNADFVLNRPESAGCRILVADRNFGCGSSREHAPWALLDFGILCVIAPSFADIFYNNCFKNGILPLALPKDVVAELMDDAGKGANATMTVDLEAQTVTRPDGSTISFEIDPFRKHCLLNGLDDIGLTLQNAAAIDRFEEQQRSTQPWLHR